MDKIEKKIIEGAFSHPVTIRELMNVCGVSSKDIEQFEGTVKELTKRGILIKIKKDKYGVRKKMGLVTGRLQGHSDGYGFVIPEEKDGGTDVFIRNRSMGDAMHGDDVVCRVDRVKKGQKREGAIIRVLRRGYSEVVGTFEKGKGSFGFVVPSEKRLFHDIFIPKELNICKAKNGQVVLARIEKYPKKGRNPEGRIIKVIGCPDDPDVEVEVAMRKYGLNQEFSGQVLTEAEELPAIIPEKEIEERLDLRGEFIITIDGENAKDFDDAVSIKKTGSGTYILGVHIADVSFYVMQNTKLDIEAKERATSVYFPDRVVPMLPFRLSNNLCSLKPDEDRLAISAFMEIGEKGDMLSFKVSPSIIRSSMRLTYNEAANLLETEDEGCEERYIHLLKTLKDMAALSDILRSKRLSMGSIDFDLPESEIILDMKGRPENIVKRERNVAHKIIEEFMLAANVSVASYIRESGMASIYRIHEQPDKEKLEGFNDFLVNFGYTIRGSSFADPKAFQKVLSEVKGKPEESLINTIMLRTMKQAVYDVDNVGHFGLSFDCYTHFTSPIRRYPDLIIHRLLKGILKGGKYKRIYSEEELSEIAKSSSQMERKAEDAEREILDIKRIQFMKDKEGNIYAGTISGVTSYGFFVELDTYFVEGLVHVSNMSDDYYIFQEEQYCLLGENTKRRFRLGDKVEVRVSSVSVEKREIDMLFVKRP